MLSGSPRSLLVRSPASRVAKGLRCLVATAALLSACHRDGGKSADVADAGAAPAASASAQANAAPPKVEKRVFAPARPGCDAVAVFAGGEAAGKVCVDDAAKENLTVVDLSDTWTPRVFAQDATTHEAPEYRDKYLELARQPNADLGLYGITPTMSVLFDRLADEKRAACDAKIDKDALGLAEISWAEAPDKRAAAASLKAAASGASLAAVQGELVCAGMLKPTFARGTMNASTQGALEAFRRRHLIVGAGLDGETLHALALGGDELAFVGVLRGLRERVADAAALVEDGSALDTKAPVLGRDLDLSRFAPTSTTAPDKDGAPDLVDEATDAAARELGWTSPAAARAFLAARGKGGVHELRVAVKLPPPPKYHGPAMELRVEIDRGDVFYETPGAAAAAKKKLGSFRSPTFTLLAKNGDHSVPLMRWSTTIGGWKKEKKDDGSFVLQYKESDVGERVWRQIIAAPAWMPPDSTPETDLVREAKDGSLDLKKGLIQPGYQNAYGLVMLIHDEPVVVGDKVTFVDHGIRTHGSVDYRSIQRGESHGCHRLYNQLALRLSGFLLQHRHYVTRGKVAAGYHRTLEWNGQSIEVDVPTRGYRYELDPPVAVRVLEGHIAGEAKKRISTTIPLKTDEPKKG